jgi:hypothetical protein
MKIKKRSKEIKKFKSLKIFGNIWKGFGRRLRGWNNAYRKGCIEGEGMLRRESMHNYMLRAYPCI